MSAYAVLETEYTSRAMLRAALNATGVRFEECAPGNEKHLVGYLGNTRDLKAAFIVRRSEISSSSNDIGWHWDPETRKFVELVSEFDEGAKPATRIRQRVSREYAVVATISAANAKGYKVRRIDAGSGAVRLEITGRI